MHRTHWIDSNGVCLRYADEGTGQKTAVLLHEMGGTLDSWDKIVPFLTSQYRVVRYDMRGFGMSEKIRSGFSLEDAIQDLDGVLDGLHINGPVALIGCAVGAGISLRMAAKRSDQVQAVVAMAPATEVPPERQQAARTFPDRLQELGIRRLVTESIAPANYPQVLRDADPKAYDRFLQQQISVDPESFVATYAMLLDGKFRPYLKDIKCPTLVIAGQYDAGRSPDVVEPVANAIPQGRFQVLPSGHFMAIQTPDLVAKAILGFLEDVGF